MKVKKQHLQLAIGAVVMAVAWSVWSYSKGSGRPPVPAMGGDGQRPLVGRDAGGPRPAQSTVQTIDPASIPAPPSIEGASESASTRDPFLFGNEVRDVKEAAVVAAIGSDPMVRSILFSSGRHLAIIENRIVGVGDKVGDFKVVLIERDAVTFTTANGERHRVAIKGPMPPGAGR